jgi:hypothetical protein
VVSKLIGVKRNLAKVLMDEEAEKVIEPLNETSLLKQC